MKHKSYSSNYFTFHFSTTHFAIHSFTIDFLKEIFSKISFFCEKILGMYLVTFSTSEFSIFFIKCPTYGIITYTTNFLIFLVQKKKQKIKKWHRNMKLCMYLFIILFTNCFSTSFKICSRNVQSTVIALHDVAKLKTIFFFNFPICGLVNTTDKVCSLTRICQNILHT